jgi:hypothetical protein
MAGCAAISRASLIADTIARMSYHRPHVVELYRVQGRYAEAETLYKRALVIGEKVLGPDYPDVGTYLSNLAGLRVSQQDWSDAVTLLKRG